MGCAEALKNAVKYAIPGAATAYAIKSAVSRWEEQTCRTSTRQNMTSG